jgi:diguanylate cyclase (GGDEF)-like protein/excisionase family DNA binding protein
VSTLPSRPSDATLSVTKAARLLGVHPNTIRAWSDAGRLRYYRINPRGDRRYRIGDLQRFLAAAAGGPVEGGVHAIHGGTHLVGGQFGATGLSVGRRPFEPHAVRPLLGPAAGAVRSAARGALQLADVAPGGTDLESDGEAAGSLPDLELLSLLSGLSQRVVGKDAIGLDEALTTVVHALARTHDLHLASIWELRGDELVPRAAAGPAASRVIALPSTYGSLGRAVRAAEGLTMYEAEPALGLLSDGRPELTNAINVDGRPWGAILLAGESMGSIDDAASVVIRLTATAVASMIHVARVADESAHQLHRAEALRRVANDIGSRLDLDQILAGLVDHAMVLFEADRGAVFLRKPDGGIIAEVSRNLSTEFIASVRDFPTPSLPASAVAARRPLFSTGYRNDPRGAGVRAAVVQEGFDTICTAPLFDAGELLGLLNLYHDSPRVWSTEDLQTMADLALQGSVAIKTAQNYAQMATWAAQLQSIQQLGARLSRLTNVNEVGLAIANELRQLIDYHNVRVYRLFEGDLVPIAMRGQVGEYVDETPEQLKVAIGEGITGWVAANKVPQNLPDAANDPRADTIPGTEADLDESMLLAPMVYEDQVLGVLVLSKLGLHQFTDDDLRLLVIYASFAAQAMANADATGLLHEQSAALEHRLRSQRELLEITESILSTLDPRAVLDQIADRLEDLVGYDNIAIEVVEPASGLLSPLIARGIHASEYLEPWDPGETGIATWVVDHNEPALILDEHADDRVNADFRIEEPVDGSLIVVPLRGREGATGVLTVERLGKGNVFSEDEFELVKLFAAQVSIALQNAEVYHAIEVRARTDGLTGLLNHATFGERLAANVVRHDPFSLVMLDLDTFKGVNDAFGHQAGDRLLREIARAIVGAGRESDHVFRYGGDEFALILPGADSESAVHVAERVRAAVEAVGDDGTEWHTGGIKVSASFGVATFPADGENAESILLAADRACFVAKRSGPGRIANAAEGLALAREFKLQDPTPVDTSTPG